MANDYSRPLADRIRPLSIDDVVGQTHILGKNGMLRRIIDSGNIPNMIFYGPSGIGKTTVANIIAASAKRTLYKLNATTASLSDIKEITSSVGGFSAKSGILLYLDEIQYFNKRQQQSLLEFIENGSVTLIASTTENPYFYVYNAILSRSTVFEFKPVSKDEIVPAVKRAFAVSGQEYGAVFTPEPGATEHIAAMCGGDVRKAVNAVELLCRTAHISDGHAAVTLSDARTVTQRSSNRYDRDGDEHYDLLSALQKSIRGSDPNAAVYYLGRLLAAGDLVSPCRRLLVMAAEDVGLAYPQAIQIVKACVDTARELGLPEAALPLAEAAVLMATAPKSNSSALAIWAAMAEDTAAEIPPHLRDAHYAGAEKLGRGTEYKYPHDFPSHYVAQQYLPNTLLSREYYSYGENKTEQAAKAYWDGIKNQI